MNTAIFLFLFVITKTWSQSITARYDKYQVYRVIPNDINQLKSLQEMYFVGQIIDFWKLSYEPNVTNDVVVPAHKIAQFKDVMDKKNIKHTLSIPDLQKWIQRTKPSTIGKLFHWRDFQSLTKINNWLKQLSEKYPSQVTLIVAGKSYENRSLTGVKVSFKKGNKAVFFEGGIHAREWISPAVVTYLLNQFLTSKNPIIREIAESFDWYFFPVFNPDGYEYTHTTDRLWRLTRHPYNVCAGVDANRNWGYYWNNGGASNKTCSGNYLGPAPFSEPETLEMSKFITSIHEDLIAYISIHSYGQFLLIPFAYTNTPLDNFEELMDIGKRVADSIKKRYGTQYQIGNWADILYLSSGTSVDWVKGTFKTPITYTFELRDNANYGFVVPATEIIPTAQEILDGILTLMKEVKYRGYNK